MSDPDCAVGLDGVCIDERALLARLRGALALIAGGLVLDRLPLVASNGDLGEALATALLLAGTGFGLLGIVRTLSGTHTSSRWSSARGPVVLYDVGWLVIALGGAIVIGALLLYSSGASRADHQKNSPEPGERGDRDQQDDGVVHTGHQIELLAQSSFADRQRSLRRDNATRARSRALPVPGDNVQSRR